MGFFDKLLDLSKELTSFRTTVPIEESKLPVFPEWFFSSRFGQPRRINPLEMRDFAKSPWVQMVLNTIKKEILIIPTRLVNVDPDDDNKYESEKANLSAFFDDINSDHQTIKDLCSEAITDVGEIDAAVWAKTFSKGSYQLKEVPIATQDPTRFVAGQTVGQDVGVDLVLGLKDFGSRQLVEMRSADSASFTKQIDIYKRILSYWQFSFKNPRNNPIRFDPDEIVYMWMNKRSYSLYGYSPVQAVQQVLEVLIQSTRWNKDFFVNNAIPDGMVNFPGADPNSMKELKNKWNKRVRGKAHELLFNNTKAEFVSFANNSRDMEWLDGQKWFFHLVFATFGVSPAEAGFHEDVNRSTQEGQERVTVKNAIKPYLTLLEDAVNRFVIPEFFQMEKPPIKFEFAPEDHAQEQIEFDQSMQMVENKIITINEYRHMRGLDPVAWGEEPVQEATQQNPNEDPKDKGSDNPNDPKKKETMIPFTKAFEGFLKNGNS